MPNMNSEQIADPTAESRKQDHIELAFKSQVSASMIDERFYYEPLAAPHPQKGMDISRDLLGHTLKTPIWVSSMTGGTEMATRINHNLAKACGEYGMGMGLGSCRSLLYSFDRLPDFDVKALMPNQPLYANLGVAQLEELIDEDKLDLASEMIKRLQADGLIIHINPLQEWLQPEGDRYKRPAFETIKRIVEWANFPLIVKEVGQGMGANSLKQLLQLPIQAIDFGAHGGTNFAMLELLRADEQMMKTFECLTKVGHSASEMTDLINQQITELGNSVACNECIISGGISTFLDGYYLTEKIKTKAIYGQASAFLKHSTGDYEILQAYVEQQIQGLQIANSFLTIKS